jgi:hypothetical protein
MKNDIAQAFLLKVMQGSTIEVVNDTRKYFQTMARFKYDDYQQYSPGMRFVERLSLWLNQFKPEDKNVALEFIREKLIFISQSEMNLLISSAFPDVIRSLFIKDIAIELSVPEYHLKKIVLSINYKMLIRQTLFCGMSDGAKMEIFRRANTGIITHEQIYQTYELSASRADKMKEELVNDLKKFKGSDLTTDEGKFKRLYLLDDFSASGTSYLKLNDKGELKGKISALYKSIFGNDDLKDVFDLNNLKVYVLIYLCTEQAKSQIESNFSELFTKYGNRPELICMHLIPKSDKLNSVDDSKIIELCNKDEYYDAEEIEDFHTKQGGANVKLGFGSCALPLVLAHNTPNNSVPILWSYETSSSFKGLFPRIPRHKEL